MPIGLGAGMAISGIASLAGGLLGRSSTSTTTSGPTWTADQQALQHQLSDALSYRLQNPGQPFEGAKVQAIDNANQNYANIQKRLQTNYSSRGFGRSGKVLTDARGIETARAGELGSLDAKFAGMQADYENQLADQAMRFAFASPGNSSTTTGPSNVLGSAVGSGLETATTLLSLNQLLKNGGSSSVGVA